MKRFVTVFLALVLVLTMAPAVRADLIYYPDDNFLSSHDCTEVRRTYVARTDVTVYESPESAQKEGILPSGQRVHVYFVWEDGDGNQWGYLEYFDEDIYGWVPMVYMALAYDHISFEEDFGHLFTHTEQWEYLDAAFAGKEVYFWTYPGSEIGYPIAVDSNSDYLPDYEITYSDADGRQWGYVTYYYGYRDYWICLSDPTADFAALYPDGAPEVAITEPLPPLPTAEIKPGSTSPLPMILGGGVVLCVIVTAVILLRRKRKE